MSKQDKSTPGMDELFPQLREENPKAGEKELQKLFLEAARGNEDLTREAGWMVCSSASSRDNCQDEELRGSRRGNSAAFSRHESAVFRWAPAWSEAQCGRRL
jgi:hypothetical protein